jgi:Flp pilus assembly protein TadG
MKTIRKTERGQALVLIVFGMVGLIGATALAIDGGGAYSDRRHAQNAADTAVMAAGLTKIRNPTDWSLAEAAGLLRAADNGYDNNGTTNDVHVYECTDAASSCTLPAGATDPENYVQVTIRSTIPTYFARVVGVPQVTNGVQAMARAVPSVPTPWFGGQALVALMPGCKGGGWPDDPFTVGGTGLTVVNGSGVFVNSNCANAFTSSNNATLTSSGGTCVVGGVVGGGTIVPPADDYCGTPVDPLAYQMPGINAGSCTTNGSIIDTGGNNYVASPGNYAGSFPNVSPAGTLKLQPGIYCLNNGGGALALSGTWDITTDVNSNGFFDDPGEGVAFYVPNGSVTFNGGSNVHIAPLNGTGTGADGYLFVLPATNTSTVKLTGGNGSLFVGTILAPASLVTLEGNNATIGFDCQVMGYAIKITGGGTIDITYDADKTGETYTSPELVPYK